MSNPFATINNQQMQDRGNNSSDNNDNNVVLSLRRNIEEIKNKTNLSMNELLTKELPFNSLTQVSPPAFPHDDANIESSCLPHYTPWTPERNQQIKIPFQQTADFQNPISFNYDIESQHNQETYTYNHSNNGLVPFNIPSKSISAPQYYKSNLQENNNNILKSQDLSFKNSSRASLLQENRVLGSSSMNSSEIIGNHLMLKPIQFEIYRQLRQAQVKREAAFFLITFEGCMSLDEAFSKLVTNENGIYDHSFVSKSERGFRNQNCEICNSPQSQHNSTLERNDSARFTYDRICELSAFGKLEDKELIQPVQLRECQICLAQVAENNLLNFKQEIHPICLDCFRQYLETEIIQAHVDQLKCPHCSIFLDEQIIIDHLTTALQKKYKYFLSKLLVNKDRLKRFCPTPNCDNVITLSTESQETAMCSQCRNVICTVCNRHNHPGMSCQKLMDKEIQELTDTRDIQRCNKCLSLVQKAEGCNHMTCSICSYQWCWLCGNTYTKFHVTPLNPFGCPLLQGGHFTVHNMPMWKIYIIRFLALLALLIILPFALILSGPFLAIAGYVHAISKKYPNIRTVPICTRIGLVLLGAIVFVLGLALDPIILILSIPLMLCGIYQYFKEQRQAENIVNQRLEQIRGRNNFHNP